MTAEQLAALSGHTEGPWCSLWDKTGATTDDPLIWSDAGPVVSIDWWNEPVHSCTEPDARLIAAAPDLLALCREQAALIELWRAKIASITTERDRQTKIADSARESVRRERKARQEAQEGDAANARHLTQAGELIALHARNAELQQARADRLARILAVEHGDASQAPDGWAYAAEELIDARGDRWGWSVEWRSAGHTVHRWHTEDGRPEYTVILSGEWVHFGTALEAMEAADAARGE